MTASNTGGSRPQTNGVLAVTASQATGNVNNRHTTSKPPAPKLKVVVRRLPPALAAGEFATILGDSWNIGQGKVDWLQYKPGKDSKEASKPSRPSRAYLHLTNESYLMELSDTVRQTVFEDVQNTFTNPCLIGPPTVEFAPYGRTPGGRPRVDARAGTIDQDAEFMAFLEGLANPISTKELNADADGAAKPEKVTTTPLVQYLKEKKASKNKEAAAKAAKKQEAQVAKGKAAKESSASPEKKSKELKPDKAVEKAAKDAVKILNREAAKVTSGSSKSSSSASASETAGAPKLNIGNLPGRQRGAVIAAHIRMLQRDLGLSPAQAHRQVRRDTADAQKAERVAAAEKAAADSKDAKPATATPVQQVPTAPRGIQTPSSSRRGRGKKAAGIDAGKTTAAPTGPSTPVILLKKPETSQSSTPAPAVATVNPSPQPPKLAPNVLARKPQSTPQPLEGATQAFVKHANPSQGVTEALLKEAMEKFGAVSTVDIDKRKGFAYVDFVDTIGLKKAMAANPISVAQGTVHVMQRKGTALPPDKKPPHQAPQAPRGGGGGGGRGGRGGTIGRRGGRGGFRGGANAIAQAPSNSENNKPAPSVIPTGPAAVAK